MKIISYNINGVKRFLDNQQLITGFFGGEKPQDLHHMIAVENPLSRTNIAQDVQNFLISEYL
jgi:hypothetical protein